MSTFWEKGSVPSKATVIAIMLASVFGAARPVRAADAAAVTAIDIVLDPDETMTKRAQAANGRVRKGFPQGFALDETHRPHVTCLQRYVRTSDLDKVYAAVGKVLAKETPRTWKLKADGTSYTPWENVVLVGISVEATEDLLRFQRKLVDAVLPYTVKTGTAAAFFSTKDDPGIDRPIIDYVKVFVPRGAGVNYRPHVTIGVATEESTKPMRDERFEAFTFSATGVSVYQLGKYGTARKQLKSWK